MNPSFFAGTKIQPSFFKGVAIFAVAIMFGKYIDNRETEAMALFRLVIILLNW